MESARRLALQDFPLQSLSVAFLSKASLLDPQLAEFSKLFEGPQKDRELLTREADMPWIRMRWFRFSIAPF